jgi:hypothetical protein
LLGAQWINLNSADAIQNAAKENNATKINSAIEVDPSL